MTMFIGHTRFSVLDPSSPNWQITQSGRFKDIDEYREYLFSPERLELRTDIFLNYSLPELSKAAEKHRIVHIISYSDLLPDPWKSKLEKAIENYDFLIGDLRRSGGAILDPHIVAEEALGGNGIYGLYRLDDDDILSSTFFSNSAKYLKEEFAGMQVSFSDGYTGFWQNNFIRNVRKVHWPMLAIGFMNICSIKEGKIVSQPRPAPHHIADRTNAVIIDPRHPSYLWLRHEDQDTANKFSSSQIRQEIFRDMEKYKPVAVDFSFDPVFPAIAKSISMHRQYSLMSEELVLVSPSEFLLPKEMNWFELIVKLDCGKGIKQHNALISFTIRDSDGDLVTEPIEGVPFSNDPKIKHYRYLKTELGESISNVEIQLPEGLTCNELRVQRFLNVESEIRVKNAKVRELT